MIAKVTILYEDQRQAGVAPTEGFGLHELVVSCVADLLGHDRYFLKNTFFKKPVPMKGNDKLLGACRDVGSYIRSRYVVAVFDSDKIREAPRIKLPWDASDSAVLAKIQEGCNSSLRVVLLRENIESILEAVGQCDHIARDYLDDAIKGKKHYERDLILNGIARNWEKRAQRDCIQEKNPSFKELVALVAGLLVELDPDLQRPPP